MSKLWILAALTTILSVGYEVRAKEYSLQVLHVFQSPGPLIPGSGVLRTSDGSLYGVTPQGDALEGGNGYGTIYRIAPDGQITVLNVFDGSYGYYPTAGWWKEVMVIFMDLQRWVVRTGHLFLFSGFPRRETSQTFAPCMAERTDTILPMQ